MSSRMEKYNSNDDFTQMSRTKRNEHIYNSTDMTELSRIKTNNNVSIISDGGKTVDLEKIRSYIDSISNNKEEERKKISLNIPEKEELIIVRKEEKDYDINSVLEKARESQERDYEENRHRKLNNTQIDILKSIKIKPTVNNDDLTPSIDELNTEEKTIVDLIQNIQNNSNSDKKKDLFDDLMGEDEDTVVMGANDDVKEALLSMTQDLESIKIPANEFTQELNRELEKLRVKEEKDEEDIEEEVDDDEIEEDENFYTSSVSFDKSDFEGFEDLERTAKKSSILTKLAIVLVSIILFGTIFIIVNYLFDLNLI